MLHCAQNECWALCPTEASGHDLEEKGKVVVKVRANLCQGWPSNCTGCLREDKKEKEREVVMWLEQIVQC